MTTIGHVPADISLWVTTRASFAAQSSLIVRPNASRPATVVAAGVASPAVHPSIVVAAIVPVTEALYYPEH